MGTLKRPWTRITMRKVEVRVTLGMGVSMMTV